MCLSDKRGLVNDVGKLNRQEQLKLIGLYVGSIGLAATIAFGWGRSWGRNEQTSLPSSPSAMGEQRQVLDLGKEQEPKSFASENASETPEKVNTSESGANINEIFVHITGRVKKPGVYKMKPGQRIKDVVELAGGVQPDADLDQINLAEKVSDSEKIIVPRKGAMTPVTMSPSGAVIRPSPSNAPSQSGAKVPAVVNVNRASAEELEQLPGVGPVLAERIIEYRRQNGRFNSVDELLEVSGIGPKKLESMRPYVRLN